MSLTATEIGLVAERLADEIEGLRVGKIYELGPDRVALALGRRGYLVLSARPGLGYVTLEEKITKPGECPAFCGLLRKHLSGSFIERVEQVGGDRILEIRCRSARLVAELFGGGIWLLDLHGKVLGDSRHRSVAGPYVPPEPPARAPGPARTHGTAAGSTRLDLDGDFWASLSLFARELEEAAALRSLRQRVGGWLDRETKRLERLASKLERDRQRAGDPEQWQRLGDLILASVHQIPRGASQVQVPNWFEDGQLVTVALDPRLGPSENAQRYYAKARRARRTLEETARRLEEVRERLVQLSEAKESLERASSLPALQAMATRLGLDASQRRQTPRRAQQERRLPFRRYVTESGLEILAGRSARDNHWLTFRIARGSDLWFHVSGRPGPHVVLRVPKGREPDEEAVLDAATLAVFLATRNRGADEEVVWTKKKYLRPVKGSPGRVTYSAAKHLHVRIDPKRLDRLLGTGGLVG